MGKRFSSWVHRVSKGWVALLALAIFLAFTALVLPDQSARARKDSGNAGSPDTSFFYAPDDLYRMAEAYGQSGREAYVRARFTFDVAWPLVYTLFLSTTISWVGGKAFLPGSRWRLTNLAPVLGALFDFLENVSTSLVMLRYPAHTAVVDFLAPLFTLAKWGFIGGSFVLLLIGIIVGAWRWSRNRHGR